MLNGYRKNKRHLGFTLVELMVVVAVISVLVTIVTVSYRGAQRSSAVASVKSDLSQAGGKVKSERYDGVSGTYPTVIPASVDVSDGVILQITVAADNRSFCIDGSHQNYSDINFYYSSNHGMGEGFCSEL